MKNSFLLASLYYVLFFVFYYVAINFASWSYDLNQPFISNLRSFSWMLAPPIASALTLGFLNRLWPRENLRFKKRLYVALFAMIPTGSLILYILGHAVFLNHALQLNFFEPIVLMFLGVLSLLTFLSIILFAGLFAKSPPAL